MCSDPDHDIRSDHQYTPEALIDHRCRAQMKGAQDTVAQPSSDRMISSMRVAGDLITTLRTGYSPDASEESASGQEIVAHPLTSLR